jgi:hypothetical protein
VANDTSDIKTMLVGRGPTELRQPGRISTTLREMRGLSPTTDYWCKTDISVGNAHRNAEASTEADSRRSFPIRPDTSLAQVSAGQPACVPNVA